jgi:hypothetical protein
MENLPAHKLASIVPMIESVGASVIVYLLTLLILTLLNSGGHNSNLFCGGSLQLIPVS